MSFEGCYQRLCKVGHLSEEDVYTSDNENYWKCPDCQESLAWWNLVDQTNDPEEGRVELKEKDPAALDVAPKIYCIPNNVGQVFTPTKSL